MTQDQVHAQPQAVAVSNESVPLYAAAPLHPVPLPTGRVRQPPIIRRAVVDNRKKTETAGKNLSWADLSSVPTISSAPYAAQLLIQYWCDKDPNTHELENLGVFVTLAKEAVAKPPPKFVESMITSLDELKHFESSLTTSKIVASQELRASLSRRRERIVKDANPTFDLRKPQLEKGVEASRAKHQKPADVNKRPGFPYKEGQNAAVVGYRKEAVKLGVTTNIVGTFHTLCPNCGEYTDSKNIQVDHQQAITEMIANLDQVAQAFTSDSQLATKYKKEVPNFRDIFILAPDKKTYQVSKGAVWNYSNDVQNLIDLCSVCNRNKSDKDLIQWYRTSTFFGQKFLDRYLDANDPSKIILKTRYGTGWADAAREWFTENHLPTLKRQTLGIATQKTFTNSLKVETLQKQKVLAAPNTPERQKLEGPLKQTTIINSMMETHHAVFLEKFNQTAKVSEKFSEMSPVKYRDALDKVNRDSRADRLRRHDDDLQYKAGVKHGYLGSPKSLVSGWSVEQTESYEIGYEDGETRAGQEKASGASDALSVDLSKPSQLPKGTDYYRERFKEVLKKRTDAHDAGVKDAESDVPVNPSYARDQGALAGDLLRDYVTGYHSVQVKSSAKNSAASSTAGDTKDNTKQKKSTK